MVYSSKTAAFINDKNQFFAQMAPIAKINQDVPINKQAIVDERVNSINYTFLLHNQKVLEAEFNQLFNTLKNKKNDDSNKEVFWFYCYYCASLLEAFYKSYGQKTKQDEYKSHKEQIIKHMNHDPLMDSDSDNETLKTQEDTFIKSLSNSFTSGLNEIITAPFHTTKIRDYGAYTNLCRVYWVFCRLTMTTGLSLAKDIKLIDKLDMILGTHTNVDKIISTFQIPAELLNYFSVGFFVVRFMIEAALLLKHTFFPTEQEKGTEDGCIIYKMPQLPSPEQQDSYRNHYIVVEKAPVFELYYISKEGKAEKLAINESEQFREELIKYYIFKNREVELQASKKEVELKASVKFRAQSKLHAQFTSSNLIPIPCTKQEINALFYQRVHHSRELTTRWDRFKYEFNKRHCNFANDLAWGTVNFLTNFPQISKISAPMCGYLLSITLVFDVCVILYKHNLAKQDYLIKKAQYLQEITHYEKLTLGLNKSTKRRLNFVNKELIFAKNGVEEAQKIAIKVDQKLVDADQNLMKAQQQLVNDQDQALLELPDAITKLVKINQDLKHLALLRQQYNELEISWKTKESTNYFSITAASLLLMGWTASILVSLPIMALGSYFVCTIAVAMYFSESSYSLFKEESLRLEQAELTGKHLKVSLKEYEVARNEFIFTMIKNTVMPLLLITTFAICWPAAVSLTVMYLGYEWYRANNRRADEKMIKVLRNPAEEDNGDVPLLPSASI